MFTQLRIAAVLSSLFLVTMASASQAMLLELKLTGENVGTGISWQSNSTISTLENKYTAGQGDWLFTEMATTNSQEMANLLTESQSFTSKPYAGTGFGIIVGANNSFGKGGAYIVFEDTGTPIFKYTGGLSPNDARPYNATFSTGTYTLQTSTGTDRFVVSSAIPEPSTWAMLLSGFAALGLLGARSATAGRDVTSKSPPGRQAAFCVSISAIFSKILLRCAASRFANAGDAEAALIASSYFAALRVSPSIRPGRTLPSKPPNSERTFMMV